MFTRLGVLVALAGLSGPIEAAGLGIGLKGGPVFPFFRYEDAESPFSSGLDNMTSGQVGVFFVGRQQRVLGFQGEINYIRKGGYDYAFTRGGLSLTVDYLQIPLLLRIQPHPRPTPKTRLYSNLGLSLDLKVHEPGRSSYRPATFRPFDSAVMVGAGIDVKRITLEVRYSRGLRRVDKVFSDTAGRQLKSNSVALLAGIRVN